MGPVLRPNPRRWVLLPIASLVLCPLLAGCGSTPAYCTDADQLKTSVDHLGKVDVAQNGLSSLKTALDNVATDANTFANEAKTTFASQTNALRTSVSDLKAALKAAVNQPSPASVGTVTTSVTHVKNSATALQNAVKSKCQ